MLVTKSWNPPRSATESIWAKIKELIIVNPILNRVTKISLIKLPLELVDFGIVDVFRPLMVITRIFSVGVIANLIWQA